MMVIVIPVKYFVQQYLILKVSTQKISIDLIWVFLTIKTSGIITLFITCRVRSSCKNLAENSS